MSDQDRTDNPATSAPERAAPPASLTRIEIRNARRPVPSTDGVDRPAIATPPETDPASAVIDLPADVVTTHRLAPNPGRVFPSAGARDPAAKDTAAGDIAPQDRAANDLLARGLSPDLSPTKVAPAAIIDLWEHLAADRLRPAMSDVDPVAIAGQWPNSLLLRVNETGRRPDLEVAHMFAPPAGGPTSVIPIDAMTVDWIVGLGREVVITGGPVHETDAVPTGSGPISCGVIALPFGTETGVDHVLCHLYRVDEHLVEGEIEGDFGLPPRDRTGIRRLFGR